MITGAARGAQIAQWEIVLDNVEAQLAPSRTVLKSYMFPVGNDLYRSRSLK